MTMDLNNFVSKNTSNSTYSRVLFKQYSIVGNLYPSLCFISESKLCLFTNNCLLVDIIIYTCCKSYRHVSLFHINGLIHLLQSRFKL